MKKRATVPLQDKVAEPPFELVIWGYPRYHREGSLIRDSNTVPPAWQVNSLITMLTGGPSNCFCGIYILVTYLLFFKLIFIFLPFFFPVSSLKLTFISPHKLQYIILQCKYLIILKLISLAAKPIFKAFHRSSLCCCCWC